MKKMQSKNISPLSEKGMAWGTCKLHITALVTYPPIIIPGEVDNSGNRLKNISSQ